LKLVVRVNEELSLDAGTSETDGPGVLIRPPQTTVFHQVLAYLHAKPDPARPVPGTPGRHTATATAALTLRWGSYLAVLIDGHKPAVAPALPAGTSRISDDEMARINIEASAALADWIDVYRSDPGFFQGIVRRAVAFLPMVETTPAVVPESLFTALASPAMATTVRQAVFPHALEREEANAQAFPSRVFANALVNTAWRNGPVEDIHAGRTTYYPLHQRRMTPLEETTLMAFAIDRLAMGLHVCDQLATEQPRRTWPEQVLPYGLARMSLITPYNWSLTESSREVNLPVTLP
jgi:hypothetical protein